MKFKSILTAALVFLLSITALAYDKNPAPFSEFPATLPPDYQVYSPANQKMDIDTSITKIIIYGTAEGFYADHDGKGNTIIKRGVGVFGAEGSGFYVGKGYFITNAHVVTPTHVTIQLSSWISWITVPVKIVTLQIMVGQATGLGSCPGELVWIDHEKDLALVKIVGNWPALKALEYSLGWTYGDGDYLYPGMSVATIVAIREDVAKENLDKTSFFEVRYGTVVDTHAVIPGPLGKDHWMELILPWFSTNDVTTTLLIYPGDSGSPVFGFVFGQPVIIGVARAVVNYDTVEDSPNGYVRTNYFASYFTRIDRMILFILEK